MLFSIILNLLSSVFEIYYQRSSLSARRFVNDSVVCCEGQPDILFAVTNGHAVTSIQVLLLLSFFPPFYFSFFSFFSENLSLFYQNVCQDSLGPLSE